MIRLAFITVILKAIRADTGLPDAAPVTKIAETLGNLLQSSHEEAQLDQQSYQAFYNWCQKTFEVRRQALTRYSTVEQEVKSKLTVHEALNKQLKDEAAQLQVESSEAKQATQQSSLLRQTEHSDYLKQQENITRMLRMLNNAVDVLQNSSASDKKTLLSVTQSVQQLAAKSNLVTDSQRDQLSLFAQQTMNAKNDQGTITESASVNQVLKELIVKFQSSIANASVEEKQANDQFNELVALKKQQFMEYVAAKDAKDAMLAEGLQRTAQDQRALQDSGVVVRGGESYLRAIHTVCTHKSTQWASRSQVRQGIQTTMQHVIKDLTDTTAQLEALARDTASQRAVYTPASLVNVGVNRANNLPANAAVGSVESDFPLNLPFVGDGSAFQANGAESFIQAAQITKQKQSNSKPTQWTSFLQVSQGLEMQIPGDYGAEALPMPLSSSQFTPMDMNQVASPMESFTASQIMMPVQMNPNTPQQPQANTYTAVRQMVENMTTQLQAESDDEDKHKKWCDLEIAKNTSVEKDKDTRVQRLTRKIDGEHQMVQTLDQDLQILEKEIAAVGADAQALRVLKLQERNGYSKYAQNHQVAQQIIRQAVAILQRFRSLAETQARNQPSQGFLLQPAAQNDVSALSSGSIEALSQLLTRYEELRGNSDKAENQSVIDFEAFVREDRNLLQVLTTAKNYKQTLRLQAMGDLDNDSEDGNALKSQAHSVQAYVARLREVCKDVLAHYDVRRERRSRNLEALHRAGEVINSDNADEVHQTLANLAKTADKEAAQLLKSSAMRNPVVTSGGSSSVTSAVSTSAIERHGADMNGLADMVSSVAAQQAQGPSTTKQQESLPSAPMEATNASMLRDLTSLQDLSASGGLSMIPAA